jgi:hypothetical protein
MWPARILAAIISTWVTVALDIVSKLRELADAQAAEADSAAERHANARATTGLR